MTESASRNIPDRLSEARHLAYSRLDSALQGNELRSYLADKLETRRGPTPPSVLVDWRPAATLPRPSLVALLSPPITVPRGMQRRCIPPLGLSYIAASLERAGFAVRVLDACVEGYEHVEERNGMVTYGLPLAEISRWLREVAPQVVATSALFSTDLQTVVSLCGLAKATLPECVTVVGGMHPTIYPNDVLMLDRELHGTPYAVDWIIRGEGELRLPKLLADLQNGLIDRNQDGLVGWLNGDVFINPQRDTIANIDDLPFPAYHLLPMERYFEINVPFSPVPKGRRVAQVLSSRGCPVGCSFCASTNLYKRYRTHSVGRVVNEIRHLQTAYRVDEIQFADDNLTLDPGRTRTLMAALEPLAIQWCTPNGTMVNTLTPETLACMKRAGLYQVTLSIDSANPRTLRELHHKPVDLERVPRLIQACKELGIWTHGTLVVGMPGESMDEIDAAFARVLECFELTSISTFIAQTIPGSELFHQAVEQGWISRQDAWTIDSTRLRMSAPGLCPQTLERRVAAFQEEFDRRSQARDPITHAQKYAILSERKTSLAQSGWRLT